MIGIIGYGMVGSALKEAFYKETIVVVDPKFNDVTIKDLVNRKPKAIFVCVPTPTDNSNYIIIRSVLDQLKLLYDGLVIVKSTILPEVLEPYDVIYNPEFLSRATAKDDMIKPPMVVIGANSEEKCNKLAALYAKHSIIDLSNLFFCTVRQACYIKYMMNTFYATKITFMNEMYDIINSDEDFEVVTQACAAHPWMGTHHFQVPGPDGKRGFGGPCLPKDTEALKDRSHLLGKVLELNKARRK